jgi:hypothetical protein
MVNAKIQRGFIKAYNNFVAKDKEENGKGKRARKLLWHRICTELTATCGT